MSGAIGGVLGDHLPCGNAVRVRLRNVDREALLLEFLAGLVGVGSHVVLDGEGLTALAHHQIDAASGWQEGAG